MELVAAENYTYTVPRSTGESKDNSFGWRRFPYRTFGNQTINIRPLIQWWDQAYNISKADGYGSNYTNYLPTRPLTAWFRVYGDKVSENAVGWLVDGWIETAPGFNRRAKFLLRNPLRAEEIKFNELQSNLSDLKRQAGLNGLLRYRFVLSVSSYGDGTLVTNYTPAPDPALYAQAVPIWVALDKIAINGTNFMAGTNYYVDLFAAKIGYIQDGSHARFLTLVKFACRDYDCQNSNDAVRR